MDARSRMPALERQHLDRQERTLFGCAAIAVAAEVFFTVGVTRHGQMTTASIFDAAMDELFAHRAMFSSLNFAIGLAVMLWPAWSRAARQTLDAKYPGGDSFEAAFKALAGGVLVSAAMALCLGAAVLFERPALPRTAALQIVTALAGPMVLAFFTARTATLGAVVLRIYRGL